MVRFLTAGTAAASVAAPRPIAAPQLSSLAPAPAPARRSNGLVSTPPLVFEHVMVVDVERGRLIPAQRIVIQGNRIRAVGSPHKVSLPPGARVIDLRGAFVMPGLWDMHVHVLAEGAVAPLHYAAYVLAGVTSIREMATPQLDSVLRWRREFAAGTKLGPRVLTPGPSVGYRAEPGGPGLDYHLYVSSPDEGRRIVDSLQRAGADFLKIYPSWGGPPMPRDVYIAMLAEARRIGFPVAGHPPLTVPALEAVDSGQKSFEHMAHELGTGLTTYDSVPPRSYDGFFAPCWRADSVGDRECAAFAAAFARHHSYFTPTLSVWAGDPADSAHDAYGKLNRGDFWLLTRLQRFGLPLLAGTDHPTWGGPAAMFRAVAAIHGELALLVAAGLTPLEALRTATLNPATYWHATDSLGTVAAGKLADLLVLEADPLADIHNTTTIRAVLANGRYLDRAELDATREDIRRRLEQAQAAPGKAGSDRAGTPEPQP